MGVIRKKLHGSVPRRGRYMFADRLTPFPSYPRPYPWSISRAAPVHHGARGPHSCFLHSNFLMERRCPQVFAFIDIFPTGDRPLHGRNFLIR